MWPLRCARDDPRAREVPAYSLSPDASSWLTRLTFSWVARLFELGRRKDIQEEDALPHLNERDTVDELTRRLHAEILRIAPHSAASTAGAPADLGFASLRGQFAVANTTAHRPTEPNLLGRAALRMLWPTLSLNLVTALVEMGIRLSTAVGLKYFLAAIVDPTRPARDGWLWGTFLVALSLAMMVTHHVLFFSGLAMGFRMRVAAMAMVYAKILRLNATALADISTGQIVNLMSNDVRRFDDASSYLAFILMGPLETVLVLVLVAVQLGPAPAFVGVTIALVLVPLQATFARSLASLRSQAAAVTDERVRLTGEVIEGHLALKMHAWEGAMGKAISSLRASEQSVLHRRARIIGINTASQFLITPLVSLGCFGTAWAMGVTLTVPSVFYTISLLNLPKLWMAIFFLKGVETATEAAVALRRINRFLALPEAPETGRGGGVGGGVNGGGGGGGAYRATEGVGGGGGGKAGVVMGNGASDGAGGGGASNSARVDGNGVGMDKGDTHIIDSNGNGAVAPSAEVVVGMGGCDFSWTNRGWLTEAGQGSNLAVARGGMSLGSLVWSGGGRGGKGRGADAGAGGGASVNTPGGGGGGGGGGGMGMGAGVTNTHTSMVTTSVGADVDAPRWSLRLRSFKSIKSIGMGSKFKNALSGKSGRGGGVGERGEGGAGGVVDKGGRELDKVNVDKVVDVERGEGLSGPVLRGVALEVRVGELVAVVGRVGAGKTSLLMALLGELLPLPSPHPPPLATSPYLRGSVAYCSQVPWIVEGTIRDNVLFGRPYEEEWYWRVVRSCCLTEDLEMLPAGDMTEIGERGINLSGGQKARVSLARAAYARPAVALLDDPLSAVDSKVGALLFSNCIGNDGVLGGAARVVTHQRHCLPMCDRVMVLRNGAVVADGAYAELVEMEIGELTGVGGGSGDGVVGVVGGEGVDVDVGGGAVGGVGGDKVGVDKVGVDGVTVNGGADSVVDSTTDEHRNNANGGASSEDGNGNGNGNGSRNGNGDGELRGKGSGGGKGEEGEQSKGAKLVVKEGVAQGTVSWRVYAAYASYLGDGTSFIIAFFFIAGQGLMLGQEAFLALWANMPIDQQRHHYNMTVFGSLSAAVSIVALIRSLYFFSSTLRASTRMHARSLTGVLRSPLSFFHTNPAGRVLNRFSKDLGIVDDLLPMVMFDCFQCLFQVVAALVMIAIAAPLALACLIPVAFAVYRIRATHLTASREVKRYEGATRSPVFSALSATIKGLPVIRAYRAQPRFHSRFATLLNINSSWWFSFLGVSRWIGFRLDAIAACIVMVMVIVTMALRQAQPGIVALAFSYVLQLSGLIQWTVRQSAEMENLMTSTERIHEYSTLPYEAPVEGEPGASIAPPDWPSYGAIEYQNVTASYRPGLPPAIRNLSFALQGGASCGVVGRTGSGKSSLMLTLFRLIPINEGRVLIDNVDTAALGTDRLRSALAIIPQDPTIFSGTLRANLDPFSRHDDAALWDALERVQLREAVAAMGGLSATVAECGDNFSVGQRQLLCLARALLQNACILALDEATANVDRATDIRIQQALRVATGERGCTLLVIAHRIDTIMDMDTLLVLDKGRLVEKGNPRELERNPNGPFGRMARAAREAVNGGEAKAGSERE